MFKSVMAVCALLLMTACVQPTTNASPKSATAEPGTVSVSSSDAGELFARVCLQTRPDFAAAKDVIATLPFTQNSRTETYYHNQLNLSFKIVKEGGQPVCSLVFASTDGGPQSFQRFTAIASQFPSSGPELDVDFILAYAVGGVNYFNVKARLQ